MIIVPVRRAVDPMGLSLSLLQRPAYRYSQKPAQLRGLGLDITSSLDTIASYDPEPISAMALNYASKVSSFITAVSDFFHIGAGRKEADQIVPIQEQVTEDVIAPIYAEILKGTALSCGTLASLYQTALAAWINWIKFLHETDWSDGRAARQAEATLAPYWTSIIGDPNTGATGRLEEIWTRKGCGTWDATAHPNAPGGGYTGPFVGPLAPTGGFSLMGLGTPLTVGIAALAFYMLSRKGR